MAWPPTTHQDVQDEVSLLRGAGEPRAYLASAIPWSIPGVEVAAFSTFTFTANRIQYEPLLVTGECQIDALGIEVTTAVAATNIRLGLYKADGSAQPTTLVVEAPTQADSSTVGVKALVLTAPVTLQPGRYVAAMVSNGAPAVRAFRGGSRLAGLPATLGTTYINNLNAVFTYGALPSSGAAWTTAAAAAAPFNHGVLLRVSQA